MNITEQSLSEAAEAAFHMTISVMEEQDATRAVTATATAASSAAAMANSEELFFFPYQEGEVIERKWHLGFIFLAYAAAFIGSHTGIRILEHGLWRSEQEKQHATFISKYPRFAMSLVLGSCAIWSMHFIGMQAEELVGIESVVCYDWLPTIGSLLLSVTGVWAGVVVAGWDIFAGPDRVDILKRLVRCDTDLVVARNSVSSSSRPSIHQKNPKKKKETEQTEQLGSYHIHCIAFFDMLHWIAAGSFLAALGALSMHYVGMIAMKGPFHREWSFVFISASVFFGVVICFVGFWILFRPLHFKVEKSWYRLASAAIIALAICFLHFFGMFAVTYTADASQAARTQCGSHFFQGWKMDQFQVLIVAMVVPMVGLFVEHTISNELRVTYRQLLDIKLSGSEFLEESKDDVEEGGKSITTAKESITTTGSSRKVSTKASKKSKTKPKPAPSDEMFASAREDPSDRTQTCADLSGLMCNDDMYSHSFAAGVWPDDIEHQDVWSDNDDIHQGNVGEIDGSLASSGDVEEWGPDEP